MTASTFEGFLPANIGIVVVEHGDACAACYNDFFGGRVSRRGGKERNPNTLPAFHSRDSNVERLATTKTLSLGESLFSVCVFYSRCVVVVLQLCTCRWFYSSCSNRFVWYESFSMLIVCTW